MPPTTPCGAGRFVCGSLFATTVLFAFSTNVVAVPAWWAARSVTNNAEADDYAVANQGQLKNMAKRAYEEFLEKLPGGVGSMAPSGTGYKLTALINGFTTNPNRDDYQAINLGQLKNVAKVFYDRLQEIGYTNAYPWTGSQNEADDFAVANLGQLKNVFNFDPARDTDMDGVPNWWETQNGFDPGDNSDANHDSDSDGLSNYQEYLLGTNPNNADTDGDGVSDGAEVANGTNPLAPAATAPGNTLKVYTQLQN